MPGRAVYRTFVVMKCDITFLKFENTYITLDVQTVNLKETVNSRMRKRASLSRTGMFG